MKLSERVLEELARMVVGVFLENWLAHLARSTAMGVGE
jgi:hypothetical protein